MVVLELIIGTCSVGGLGYLSLVSQSIAQEHGMRNTRFFSTNDELNFALQERMVYFGLNECEISAYLEPPTEKSFVENQGAEVESYGDDYTIRLDPSRGCNNQYFLDHELAHIYRDHFKKLKKFERLGSFVGHMIYLFIFETEADMYAAGFITPKIT